MQTQRFEIVIDVIGTVCKLIEPNVNQLKDIIGIEHTPGALFHKLQRRGINLFPTPYDCNNCEGIKKPNKVSILQFSTLIFLNNDLIICTGYRTHSWKIRF